MIRELPWAEVARRPGSTGREPIPLLEDLLGAWPDVRVNIDPEARRAPSSRWPRHSRRPTPSSGCASASFSDRRIARLRELLGPALCTSIGPEAVARLRAARVGAPAGDARRPRACRCRRRTAACRSSTSASCATAHRPALPVHVWTIDEPAEMHRLLDLGVDGIMTDRPTVLKDVLVSEASGQSPSLAASAA